jgi:hypothetical protein
MFGRSKKSAASEPAAGAPPVRLLSSLLVGALAGVAATWVLDRFQQGAIAATRRAEAAANAGSELSRLQQRDLETQQLVHADSAARLARAAGRRLSRAERQRAVPIVHYAAGALAGAVYGVAAELVPAVRRGYGTGYANLIFLGGQEALMPWFGLAPRQGLQLTPAGLSAPLVFGAALETGRRVLRRLL